MAIQSMLTDPMTAAGQPLTPQQRLLQLMQQTDPNAGGSATTGMGLPGGGVGPTASSGLTPGPVDPNQAAWQQQNPGQAYPGSLGSTTPMTGMQPGKLVTTAAQQANSPGQTGPKRPTGRSRIRPRRAARAATTRPAWTRTIPSMRCSSRTNTRRTGRAAASGISPTGAHIPTKPAASAPINLGPAPTRRDRAMPGIRRGTRTLGTRRARRVPAGAAA